MNAPEPFQQNRRAPDAPDYLPFEGAPHKMAMGLRPMPWDDWIQIDANYTQEMALRRELLATRHAEVFAALGGSGPAQRETLDLLTAHLPERFPDRFRLTADRFENLVTGEAWDLSSLPHDPLEVAGRLVQEDLQIMEKSPETGRYHLTASVLCFPTRWLLADKIGQPLARIHGPVPGYHEHLESLMDRFFDQMRVDKPVQRKNFSILDRPDLFQPSGRRNSVEDLSVDAVPERVTLRVERQTLRRLPESSAILFTIRIYQRHLGALADRPEQAGRLAESLRALPDAMQAYKNFGVIRAPVLAWLDRVAASARRKSDAD